MHPPKEIDEGGHVPTVGWPVPLSARKGCWQAGRQRTLSLLKRFAGLLFGPYRIIRVYEVDVSTRSLTVPAGYDLRAVRGPGDFETSTDERLREHAWYVGDNAFAFGIWEKDQLVCECVFWNRIRFRDLAIGSLSSDEMVMVDLLTASAARGRGFAPIVIRYAEAQLKGFGYRRLVTWVWHSNGPSIRTFEKARWTYTALVVEIFPFGRRIPWRFRWRVYANV